MAKQRGNPDWGKPKPLGVTAYQCDFEYVANELGLSPSQYADSPPLRDWARRYKDDKYVPPELLKQWGLVVRGDF